MRKILTLGVALVLRGARRRRNCRRSASAVPVPEGQRSSSPPRQSRGRGDEQLLRTRLARWSSAPTRSTQRRTRSSRRRREVLLRQDPGQPNVKMTYHAEGPGASGRMAWTGPGRCRRPIRAGFVNFRVLRQDEDQAARPVRPDAGRAAQLTITNTPPTSPPGPPPSSAAPCKPRSARHRPVRGHRQRDAAGRRRPAAGRMHADQRVQARRAGRRPNVGLRPQDRRRRSRPTTSTTAHFTVPGVSPNEPQLGLARAAAQVFFWTNAWNIPATYPLGDATVQIAFTLDDRQDREARLPDHDHPVEPKAEGSTQPMNQHSCKERHRRAARLAALLLPAPAFATPTPLDAAGDPRRRGAAGPARRPAASPPRPWASSRPSPTSASPARRSPSRAPASRRTRT